MRHSSQKANYAKLASLPSQRITLELLRYDMRKMTLFSIGKESKGKNTMIRLTLILAVVLIAVGAVVASGFAKVESLWIVFPLVKIRISTLAKALACFALVLFMQRKNALKSVYFAFLAVIVPMGLFEIIWYYSAAFSRGWDLRIMQFAALFGWILLGINVIFRQRPPKISVFLYGTFVLTFAIWLGTGFKSNDLGAFPFSFSAEVFNVISKGALFFAYATHVGSVGNSQKA